jgi:membrane protease YdiL (CAAX protease family)
MYMGENNDQLEPTVVWGGWATLAWGIVVTALFIVTQLFVMGLYITVYHGNVPESEIVSLTEQLLLNGTVISLATMSTFIIGSLVIVGIIKLKKYSELDLYLGLKLPSRQQARYWFIIFTSLLLFSELLNYFLDKNEPHEFMVSAYATADPLWLLWIAMIIAAPVFEELFFRGFLLAGFRRTFLGTAGAVVVTSLLWAVIHTQYDLYYMATIFVMGVVLGLARVQSGSLVLPIGLHAFVNGLATLQTAYLV